MEVNIQEVSQIISSVGFPIVFCLLMWKYISTTSDQMKEVISKFTVTMAENNRLLLIICDKLDVSVKE